MQHTLALVWLMLLTLSFFATVFGVYYLVSKENMALIERGINPKTESKYKFPGITLKVASFLIGAGLGLMLANILNMKVFKQEDIPALYFGLTAVGGGIGLLIAYAIEMKWLKARSREQNAA